MRILIVGLILLAGCTQAPKQDISRIWLTFSNEQATHITISWESPEPGNSEVVLVVGDKKVYGTTNNESEIIHHIEVPLKQTDVKYKYKVKTGNHESDWLTFNGMPSQKPLKIAVIADWGFAPDADITNLLNDEPSIIITAGDNVPSLFNFGKEGNKHCINSYLALVDSFPELFNRIPFMPALGNHDHQLHPRGPKPPKDYMVYDTSGTAFLNFFNLSEDGWKWSLSIPQYNIRFVTLDLHHIHDYGNNWQTCHAYHSNSEQYLWYKEQMSQSFNGKTVTILNANMPDIRTIDNAIWSDPMSKSSLVISGSGYYAEKTTIDNTVYLNTSLIAGDVWPDAIDPKADFSESIATYILLTTSDNKLIAEIKTLDSKVFNQTIIEN